MAVRTSQTLISLLLLACLGSANVEAYSQSVSTFGGRSVFSSVHISRRQQSPNAKGSITMKKGKANVPPMMRSQYKRQQELGRMRDEMQAAQTPGADGLPVFNLFVRTKRANVSISFFKSNFHENCNRCALF